MTRQELIDWMTSHHTCGEAKAHILNSAQDTVDLQLTWVGLRSDWRVWYLMRYGWRDPFVVAAWLLRELAECTGWGIYREVALCLEERRKIPYAFRVLPDDEAHQVDDLAEALCSSRGAPYPSDLSETWRDAADAASLLVGFSQASCSWRGAELTRFPFNEIRKPGDP